MSAGTSRCRPRGLAIRLLGVGGVALGARILGYPLVGQLVIGALITYLAIVFGRPLTLRVMNEQNPGRELLWDSLLVLTVVLGLVGVGVMATAIP